MSNKYIIIEDPTPDINVNIEESITQVVEIVGLGPKGDRGDSIFNPNEGGSYSTTSSLEVTGSLIVTQGIIGSLQGTASFAVSASWAPTPNTGSLVTTSSFNSFTSSYNTGSFTGSFKGDITGSLQGTSSFAQTASFAPSYTLTSSFNSFTGSYNTGSFTGSFTGSLKGTNSTLYNTSLTGDTLITGSLTISSSQNQTPATFQIYGDISQKGGTFYQPVNLTINPNLSGSYIFSSGSTNDLYFAQSTKGYTNITRLRWLEGNLYTGLLNGGLITSASATTFNISSGSGLIVNLNASLNDSPYPTVEYVNWDNITNQPLTYLT